MCKVLVECKELCVRLAWVERAIHLALRAAVREDDGGRRGRARVAAEARLVGTVARVGSSRVVAACLEQLSMDGETAVGAGKRDPLRRGESSNSGRGLIGCKAPRRRVARAQEDGCGEVVEAREEGDAAATERQHASAATLIARESPKTVGCAAEDDFMPAARHVDACNTEGVDVVAVGGDICACVGATHGSGSENRASMIQSETLMREGGGRGEGRWLRT